MRHSFFASALLLAGALSAFASVDNALLALVPVGTKFVGSVDVARARNSDFGQYLLNKAQNDDAHFQEMIDATGFDPRRDLQYILFATGDPSATGKPSSFAILARGNFDPARITTLASTKTGANVVTYNGVNLIVNSHGRDQQQTALAFPKPGIAVLADLTTAKQMVNNIGLVTTLDPDLSAKIQSIGATNDAWFVSLVGGSFLADHAAKPGAPPARALQGVVEASGGVKLGALIETTLDATARSAQDATSLTDVIRFMASMVQMQRQSDPRANILATALDGMTLENAGSAVHFAVALPEKSLEELADAAPHRPNASNKP